MARGGLDGVVVADTRLSRVDGEAGCLVVRGHDVEDLAGQVPFEGLCGLFWEGSASADGAASRLRRRPRRLPGHRGRARHERLHLHRKADRITRPSCRYVGPEPRAAS